MVITGTEMKKEKKEFISSVEKFYLFLLLKNSFFSIIKLLKILNGSRSFYPIIKGFDKP